MVPSPRSYFAFISYKIRDFRKKGKSFRFEELSPDFDFKNKGGGRKRNLKPALRLLGSIELKS